MKKIMANRSKKKRQLAAKVKTKSTKAPSKLITCPQCDRKNDGLWNNRYCLHCGCNIMKAYQRFPTTLKRKRRKLLGLFEQLRAKGIEARPCFLDCTTAADYEINKLTRKNRKCGYAYWHWQDEDSYWVEGNIFIAFGAVCNDRHCSVRIGRVVARVLRTSGLRVKWDGNPQKKIEVM